MDTDFPNVNALWCHVLVETLATKGMEYAVICPGSRSSPLAFAFSNCASIEALPVLDERSAAFFALGLAKRTGKPASLVCTSGTAAANFFPAVIEASEGGVPLMVLTADRPPEMRQCSAGQTIDQVKLYGHYVKEQIDMALPEASESMLRYARETASYFYEQSTGSGKGPVHLNLPFRDPLPPMRDEAFAASLDGRMIGGILKGSDLAESAKSSRVVDLSGFVDTDEGVLIVGPNSPVASERWVSGLTGLAERLAWPILCDGLNPLRNANAGVSMVTRYDSICRSKKFVEKFQPKKAIVVGELPTSKVLRGWLASIDLEIVFLSELDRNLDPGYSRSLRIECDIAADQVAFEGRSRGNFFDAWMRAEDLASGFLQKKIDVTQPLFEGKIASVLSRELQEGASVLFSNGMPPRDCEFFWERGEGRQNTYFNRGVNGIDGVLSTAVGVAHGGDPTVLVIGDLALLHDTNGALLGRVLDGSLTIVLINNAGGGIFEMLPVAQFGQTFEDFFACDQGVNFANWAKTYGIGYQSIENWEELREAVRVLPQKGVRLLELRTDRKTDAARRKAWFAETAELLDGEF
ncbi:MAG: 2-succinyl-5-enolpyruvyl-6-hydroxy-3-cyclohexene-1-carboxylic-acid synthase [Verrucomicrobiota bacterium]